MVAAADYVWIVVSDGRSVRESWCVHRADDREAWETGGAPRRDPVAARQRRRPLAHELA